MHISRIPAPLERPTDDDAVRGIVNGIALAILAWALLSVIGGVLLWVCR